MSSPPAPSCTVSARASLSLTDGTQIVLDHRTTVAFAPDEPRHVRLAAGRLVADVVHVDNHPASFRTPAGEVHVVGTRFALTTTDTVTSVQVVRGTVVLEDPSGKDDVRAGEEGIIENGQLSVAAAPSVNNEVAWSELEQSAPKPGDEVSAGIGSLRAYKPGEQRDRDWNLALAKHDVKVRIVGPIARTEITETFKNPSDQTLEGVYQFPLPADAQIDGLALDSKDGFLDGAFVDKQRGAKIFQGVIDKAAPKIAQHQPNEIIWVPGRWKDPALLEWQRGGRFELKVYPIPGKGERTIKLAYTQVVTPHGASREYIYPLPHSRDGSTVADQMTVDVEVRGAMPGQVHAANYDLQRDPNRSAVEALVMTSPGFVPRGDLVIDYKAQDGAAELRAWTFAGGVAVAPDDKLAQKKDVGIDPKVIEAQKAVAADARPTAVLALRPQLPRWREDKPRDYAIVLDASQSMVGERFVRARALALAIIGDMDRRDRFTVLTCDSECRSLGDVRAPSAKASGDVKAWLDGQTPAGASDVVTAIRAGGDAMRDRTRERWVLFVGDGFATTGFRRAADVERAIASNSGDTHVTSIGIGADADTTLLAAVARGGGGGYIAYAPGQRTSVAANAALATSFGASLSDATVELPAGLADVAPSVLPTVRAGEEILVAARVTGEIDGQVVLKGKIGGQPFEQKYPLKLAVSAAAGNGFVPRLWASLAIDQLERSGKAEDRTHIVALSQGYGVMSRETSLLVLESQQMFDAFGVDRHQPNTTWTGEEALDEATASGLVAYDAVDNNIAGMVAALRLTSRSPRRPRTVCTASYGIAAKSPAPPPAPKPTTVRPNEEGQRRRSGCRQEGRPGQGEGRRGHAAQGAVSPCRSDAPAGGGVRRADGGDARGVGRRSAQVSPYDAVAPQIKKAVADFDDALAKNPDSRERHRDLVQALAYAGEIDRARDVAQRWLDRDALDPQALGYQADLLGRDGQRELALRTLAGLVDLDADKVPLHERMVRAYEHVGRLAQACGHRVAIASLQPKDAGAGGAAVRCLRAIGRDRDAEIVLHAVDDAQRAAVEKAATVAPVADRVAGDFVVNAHWSGNADLDISIVTPDGTRISWMGGRPDVITSNVTSTEREELALKAMKKGNYLVEITRGTPSTSTIRGTMDVTVFGEKQSLPFELSGTRTVVGRVSVWLAQHLEDDDGNRWHWVGPHQLAPY